MISIIIPTYNCAKYLRKCLESLKLQTFKDYEIIVVDDGSTDKTAEVIEDFYLTYIYQPHQNANVARNLGYKNADEDRPYVIFCDADCVYKPNFLMELYRGLESNPNAPFAYGNFYFKGEMLMAHTTGEFNYIHLLNENYIDTSALIRKEFFPGFDENLKRLQDWDLWLNIVLNETKTKPVYINNFIYDNIIRKKSVTNIESWEEARQYIITKYNLHGKV